ncbi:GerMN domain-containing protein [Chlorogloeopsis sp. ULAP01]|uniref:GerMN domain-containing protein n=1 Tax=Chlorogloeopsis sp. ULAP01 TaxID=3056483 RepID=UPI0025AB0304|nr:GerMN domain-containing protein [Chlorogloeopsis sp. ULAP01]MDM9380188.1 GerMN domain-containing protein [Chlorogloeopsis sp. ULAP01]
MNQQQGSNRISSGLIAVISATIVAVGGGVAWFVSSNNPSTVPSQQPNTPTQSLVGNEKTAQIYWLQDTGASFKLVPQQIQVAANRNQPDRFLEAAFQRLLEGTAQGNNSTTIPPGTKLLGVDVENDSVRVNLSEEFSKGGGSASMMGRIGQVVYTATSLNPNAKVYIDVNGRQLDVLGGEGVELEQPLTRESFDRDYQL